MFKKNIFLVIVIGFFLTNITLAQAANTGILPQAHGKAASGECLKRAQEQNMTDEEAKTYCGNYELNDFLRLGIKVAQFILGIVGSLALLMFIYGGFMFLISAGSADSIGKAKKIIIAAVIGLVIVFSSYLIIKTVMEAMGLNWNGEAINSSGNIVLPAKTSALIKYWG